MSNAVNLKSDKLRNALTVAELIEMLSDCDPKAVVFFASDYGDRIHTQQALPVREVMLDASDEGQIVSESSYSHSGMAFKDAEGEENDFVAVVLS